MVTWLNDGVCKAPSAPTGHSVYVRLQLCQGCRCSIPSPLNRHAENLKNLTMAGLVCLHCLHVKAHIWQSAPIQPAQCAQCAPHGRFLGDSCRYSMIIMIFLFLLNMCRPLAIDLDDLDAVFHSTMVFKHTNMDSK